MGGASRLAGGLDFVSDLGVIAFAAWTLIAYVGMATGAKVILLVAVWLATIPFLAILLVALARRSSDPPVRERVLAASLIPIASSQARRLLIATLAAGLAASVLAAIAASEIWVLVWAGVFLPIALAVVMGPARSEDGRAESVPAPDWPAHAFAAGAGLVFAAMSLFISRADGDDPFYVNRATGTAQLNRIPVRDIIFTNEQVGPISGTGLPVETFSPLQGAIGRLIDVHAASVAYYLTPPLMTFFATWALWRLLRLWAPRHLVLCFALGCAYWVFSAETRLAAGSYFLTRMWQGKVVFVAWLVMTIYVFLTRWLAKRDAAGAVLLLAAGVSSIGLTGSAGFIAPFVFAAGGVALLIRRDWRGLPAVLTAAAIPVVVALVAAQKYPLTHLDAEGPLGKSPYVPTSEFFHNIYGVGVLAAVGLLALCAAPWLARLGPAAALTTGIAVVSVVLLAPFVLPTLNDVSGLGRILSRTLWVAPLPAIVGLLAAVPVAQLVGHVGRLRVLPRRLAAAAPAVLVAALLVVFGHPLWLSLGGNSIWVREPGWKTGQKALADTWAILRRYDGSGPILADERIMRAISLVTVRPKAVDARRFYARLLPEPRQRIFDRLALTHFVAEEEPIPARGRVLRALADLRVDLVCVRSSKEPVIREVETMADYRKAFEVREIVCFRRRA